VRSGAIDRLLPRWAEAGQAAVLGEHAHRPWPIPDAPWVMAQTWLDLLFAHWPLPPERLRPHLPAALPIDTFDGSAWLGITPFEVSGLRPRGMPPLPRLSRFPELNVRTYTTLGEKPGIWFFSLDAGSAAAVAGARLTYRLPYFRADMAIERVDGRVRYRSERTPGHGAPAALGVTYAPSGPQRPPTPGTLEHWLTERYCLYTVGRRGEILRAEIQHPPWPLQPATAAFAQNTMPPAGVPLPAQEPLLHFAGRQDVLVWPPRPAASARGMAA
jgi:uncharacterized protein YqjF (DUF2071 family)